MKDDPKDTPARPAPDVSGKAGKLPYERPAVISDEVFETLALSCANARFACPPDSGNRS